MFSVSDESWRSSYYELDAKLMQAHVDSEPVKLAELYTLCADTAEHHNDTNASCFYLTHALVYALEAGIDEHETLSERLKTYGRI